MNITQLWDLGEEDIVKPSQKSLACILNALILCGGQLRESHSSEIRDGEWIDKANLCAVTLRIALPIGLEDKFQQISGYKLTKPDLVGATL